MTEKQKIIVDQLIQALPETDREAYRNIVEYAVSLGYTPKKLHADSTYVSFFKNKVGRTIMKVSAHHNECLKVDDVPGLYLNFYANEKYSDIFQQGVKKVIEHFGGKYTGCYGCGKCDGTYGYTYTYPDADRREIFKCGFELVELPPIDASHVDEIKRLLKIQDEFFVEHFSK